MKNYLSFGGGVNSVAMMLVLMDEGVEFEAVYAWMPDWPETHEYLMMLEERGYPITVITGGYGGKREGIKFGNLYDYAWFHEMMPSRVFRWCTAKFKINVLHQYYNKPCFNLLGIDNGESHRAKLSSVNGIENRFPLIEREIDREKCIDIIKSHNLPIPMKSGCYICPFQRKSQLKELRRIHPDLFCKLSELEKRNNLYRANRFNGALGDPGSKMRAYTKPYYFMGKPVSEVINEPDTYLFDDMAYPPCQCGL